MSPSRPAPANSPRTLNAAYARLLVSYLLRLRPELVQVLSPQHMAMLDERQPAARCALTDWHALMDVAEQHLGRRDLVPELAEQFKPWHAGLLGFTLMTSPNVNKLAGLLRRYHSLLNDVFMVEPGLTADKFFLRLNPASAEVSPRLARLSLSIWAERLRWLTGRADLKLDVCLRGPEPADLAPYRRIFGGQVRFHQDEDAMYGDIACVSMAIVSHDPASHVLLQHQARKQLEEMAPGEERLIDRLHSLIHIRLDDGKLSLEDVASAMKLPARTLQRRLEESGLSFRQVVEDVRRTSAERYLSDTNMSLAEMAAALGFADHASFNRAFKRWTGSSPGAFRRARQQMRLAAHNDPANRAGVQEDAHACDPAWSRMPI
ncbi:MAG: AraC family transcriptional regulator ligand-binding domain-containing protein [Aquabacterium sp.]